MCSDYPGADRRKHCAAICMRERLPRNAHAFLGDWPEPSQAVHLCSHDSLSALGTPMASTLAPIVFTMPTD